MKKIIPIIIILVIAISSCSQITANTANPIVITDALGREISFNTLPQKIIVAGKQTPMLVNFFYLFKTAPEKIAAIENRSQIANNFLVEIDPGIESKYTLEKGASAEQIAPLNPDVVILKTTMRDSIGKGLEEIGIPVVYIEFETIDQIYRDLCIFANLLGEQKRGDSLINEYQSIKAEVDQQVEKAAYTPQVVEVQAEDQDGVAAFSVPSVSYLQTSIVENLGASALWKEAAQSGGWNTVNVEQILNWSPEYFFVINYQGEAPSIIDNLKQDSVWQNMDAVKADHVFAFAMDSLSWDQPDPRWILGYSWMASKLYLDLVSSDQALSITQSFYKDFYGLTEDEFNQIIAPTINEYFG